MSDNLLFLTDSYKISHWPQYPPDTDFIYSYLESRGGVFRKTLFFGLQYYLKKYLAGQRITIEHVEEAREFYRSHFGRDLLNYEGWSYIAREHGGYLPVVIKAVPEGTVVDTRNILVSVENTDRRVPWLTNILETLLVQVWYPTTVATLSFYMKDMIGETMDATMGNRDGLEFKLHDFGFRGVSSVESAGLGGAAHLVNFLGTDTPRGILTAQRYYGAGMCGFSIPASEHSTITSWGRENEVRAYENMLNQYPDGLVACVSDSYDIFKACSELWGKELKAKVLARDGTLVVRPDSGEIVPTVMEVLRRLGDAFGTTLNSKGYRVLNPKVRVIQGDGVDLQSCRSVLTSMEIGGWSAENVAFGMGGALLQRIDRDTQKMAFKCSNRTAGGQDYGVSKSPITDPGKRSKTGRLRLVASSEHGEYPKFHTLPAEPGAPDELIEVFRDGKIMREYTFDEVRRRASQGEA